MGDKVFSAGGGYWDDVWPDGNSRNLGFVLMPELLLDDSTDTQ